ncbi:MAG TPA: DUF72 domain-containing protein [Actinomycetota bacterium]|nr:DUF72 domain-containing protein [Actinomycetota bacterium]
MSGREREPDTPAWQLALERSVRVGICSWTDRSMLTPGVYYPPGVNTAEGRLRYVVEDFPVLEVDSTYYALPAERNAVAWAERTPQPFAFNVKAFSLLTHHPTRPTGLPKALREALDLTDEKKNLYIGSVPDEVVDEVWSRFASALEPLREADKLTSVLFQFPEWFVPSKDNRAYIVQCRDRMTDLLPGVWTAVEFRNGRWMDTPEQQERTLGFLEREGLPYVCVDMPQGFRSSIPPVVAATADLAMVRFHGRRSATWEKKGISARERFRYDYSADELAEWVPGVTQLRESAREVHVMMNNCYRDYAVRSGKKMTQLTLEATGSA